MTILTTSLDQNSESFAENKKTMQVLVDDLREKIVEDFSGKTLKMIEIYKEHNVDTPYIKKNYKDALKDLLENDRIKAISKTGKQPRKGTFGDDIIVTF